MTNTKITTADIEALRQGAGQAGDDAQVALCDAAIEGDTEARAECARVIAEARALADLKTFEFSANDMVFGEYSGADLEEAQEAFAVDSGYASWAAMVEQAEEFGGNTVESREID